MSTRKDSNYVWDVARLALPRHYKAVHAAWVALPEMEKDATVSKILLLRSVDSTRTAADWEAYWDPIQDVLLALANIKPTWRTVSG